MATRTSAARGINVTRCYLNADATWASVTDVQLHHFSDASETGYGTVSYLRIVTDDGGVNVRFLLAETRCAPKNFVSVPRLELQAATVAARVDRFIRRELNLPCSLDKVEFWTDSTIVLGYIKCTDKRYKTYVAYRIEEIHDSSEPHQWRHCPTKQNPADLASRGCGIGTLVHREL
jgi:hypothetical protein